MSSRDRLKRFEIAILKYLYRARATHTGNAISLKEKFREFAIPLWRRRLVEVWHQQIPDEGSRGPFYALSPAGERLVTAILNNPELPLRKRANTNPAPRGFSGAGTNHNGQSSSPQ